MTGILVEGSHNEFSDEGKSIHRILAFAKFSNKFFKGGEDFSNIEFLEQVEEFFEGVTAGWRIGCWH